MATTSNRKKDFIDFNKLSEGELQKLSKKWYAAAHSFEIKLESTLRFDKTLSEDQINVLWNRANQLWKRVSILERWERNRKKKA